MIQLARKGTKFEWKDEQQKAFEILKNKLITASILAIFYPDFAREFAVRNDASGYTSGTVLSQGEAEKKKPVAYASRVLNKAEKNYSTTEKELLATVWTVNHFRPYLYGTKFKVSINHKTLVWWRLKLENDYEIVYKKGKANANTDALSRNPLKHAMHIKEVSESETEEVEKKNKKEYSENEKRKIPYI